LLAEPGAESGVDGEIGIDVDVCVTHNIPLFGYEMGLHTWLWVVAGKAQNGAGDGLQMVYLNKWASPFWHKMKARSQEHLYSQPLASLGGVYVSWICLASWLCGE
jgi:hypothetical protein